MNPTLTPRETEALELVGRGLSVPEIAEAMNITQRGAKWHVDTLRAKFGVDKKRQLIPIAQERRP